MTTGAWILIAAVALALGVGLWRLRTDGRFAGATASHSSPLTQSSPVSQPSPAADVVRDVGGVLGERATLLQFSSAFCAPCRTTRVVLAEVAAQVEGVVHLEVDAELHLEATRTLGVMRTPTTILLDARGAEASRASGAPTRDQVLAALDKAIHLK